MWIGERSKSIVLFLSGSVPKIRKSIPESEVDHFVIDFHGGSIVIKNSGNVFGGEFVLSITGLE